VLSDSDVGPYVIRKLLCYNFDIQGEHRPQWKGEGRKASAPTPDFWNKKIESKKRGNYQKLKLFLKMYCDMHAVGQQSTVETLFITVTKQRNNGSDQRFLGGPFR
jgi:hypothetical protein